MIKIFLINSLELEFPQLFLIKIMINYQNKRLFLGPLL